MAGLLKPIFKKLLFSFFFTMWFKWEQYECCTFWNDCYCKTIEFFEDTVTFFPGCFSVACRAAQIKYRINKSQIHLRKISNSREWCLQHQRLWVWSPWTLLIPWHFAERLVIVAEHYEKSLKDLLKQGKPVR